MQRLFWVFVNVQLNAAPVWGVCDCPVECIYIYSVCLPCLYLNSQVQWGFFVCFFVSLFFVCFFVVVFFFFFFWGGGGCL